MMFEICFWEIQQKMIETLIVKYFLGKKKHEGKEIENEYKCIVHEDIYEDIPISI